MATPTAAKFCKIRIDNQSLSCTTQQIGAHVFYAKVPVITLGNRPKVVMAVAFAAVSRLVALGQRGHRRRSHHRCACLDGRAFRTPRVERETAATMR